MRLTNKKSKKLTINGIAPHFDQKFPLFDGIGAAYALHQKHGVVCGRH